jgi:hypothetical protein
MEICEDTPVPVLHRGRWYFAEKDVWGNTNDVIVHCITAGPWGTQQVGVLPQQQEGEQEPEHAKGIASCPLGIAVAADARVACFDDNGFVLHQVRAPAGFCINDVKWCGDSASVLLVVYGNKTHGDNVAAIDFRSHPQPLVGNYLQPSSSSASARASSPCFVSSICSSSNANSLVVGYATGDIKICDVRFARPGEEVLRFQAPPNCGAVSALASCPAHSNWVAAGYERSPVVRCVNTLSGKSNGALDSGRRGTTALAFGGVRGNELFSGHLEPNKRAGNCVRRWRMSEGAEGPCFKHLQELTGHHGTVTALAASGNRVYSVGGLVNGHGECTHALSEWTLPTTTDPNDRKRSSSSGSQGSSENCRKKWSTRLDIR